MRDAQAYAREHLSRIKLDTFIGMGVLQPGRASSSCLTTAVTLHPHGITDIQTSAQAAEALRPIAGDFAFLALRPRHHRHRPARRAGARRLRGLCVSELFGWKAGLDAPLREARGFYSIIIAAHLLGIALDFSPLDPIKALVWSAIVNGVIAVPIMVG